jgi:hypothetical protein
MRVGNVEFFSANSNVADSYIWSIANYRHPTVVVDIVLVLLSSYCVWINTHILAETNNRKGQINMAYIETEGRYLNLTLKDLRIVEDLGWEDQPDAFKIVFYAETPDGLQAKSDLVFSTKEFWDSKQNKNITSAAKAQATLEACGIPDGNPAHLPRVLSGELEFNFMFVAKRGGDSRQYLNFYLNPKVKDQSINDADMTSLAARFSKMTGAKVEPPKPQAPPPFPVEQVTAPEVVGVDPMSTDDDTDCPF